MYWVNEQFSKVVYLNPPNWVDGTQANLNHHGTNPIEVADKSPLETDGLVSLARYGKSQWYGNTIELRETP